ncbi:hypothetical protein HPB47_017200 [Ixodes persulcatus]|uniref:Uncharacterized protein n=1 Tax=Ixodes persulcatus TaxID=34615 RepID=A0AC60QNX0_IXOPE|nr:hypothetical protein HPB47_017200 [Ixodes persulcatus]
MVKAALMKLVKTVKVEGDTYRIDRIASEAAQVDTIRLCQEPNPAVWSVLAYRPRRRVGRR